MYHKGLGTVPPDRSFRHESEAAPAAVRDVVFRICVSEAMDCAPWCHYFDGTCRLGARRR